MENTNQIGILKDNVRELRAVKLERERRLLQYIRLDLTALPHPVATCLVCKETVSVPNSDNFKGCNVWVTGKDGMQRQVWVKTNKDLLKRFQEKHYVECIKDFGTETKQFGK